VPLLEDFSRTARATSCPPSRARSTSISIGCTSCSRSCARSIRVPADRCSARARVRSCPTS
jgi:hypothetical protein